MDLKSRRVKAVTTTTSATGIGGDFRPSWSPDGKWIAFSSDRGTTHEDGARAMGGACSPRTSMSSGPTAPDLKRVNAPGNFCGSPKFSSDGSRLLAYCMPLESTLETRRPNPLPGNDTTLVSIDVATGTMTDIAAGPGVKISPAFLPGNDIGYVRKDSSDAGIYYTERQARTARQRARGGVVAGRQPRRLSSPANRAANVVAEGVQPQSELRAGVLVACCRRSIRRAIVRDGRPARGPQRRSARASRSERPASTRPDHLQGQHAQRPRAAVVAGRRDDPVRRRHLPGVLQRLRQPHHEPRRSRRGRRADRDHQSRWQRLPRDHERRQQQRLPVDVARRQALRLSNVRPRRRGPSHHEHRDAGGHHADEAATTISRSGRRAAIASSSRASPMATTRSIRSRRMAPA